MRFVLLWAEPRASAETLDQCPLVTGEVNATIAERPGGQPTGYTVWHYGNQQETAGQMNYVWVSLSMPASLLCHWTGQEQVDRLARIHDARL